MIEDKAISDRTRLVTKLDEMAAHIARIWGSTNNQPVDTFFKSGASPRAVAPIKANSLITRIVRFFGGRS